MTSTMNLTEVAVAAAAPEGLMVVAHAAAVVATVSQLTRAQVLERGQSWIDERVPYSQTAWWTNRFGRYRQDCSGYISMCWALGTSYTTATIMQVADRIGWADLQGGDALWRRSATEGHIALFVGWADGDHTRPIVHEEYDFGEICERRVWSPGYTRTFSPIRSRNIGGDGPLPEQPVPVFRTWGSGVRIRREPNTGAQILTTLRGPTTVKVRCQVHGQRITAEGITNDGWSFLPDYGGYLSNIYIDHPAYWLPGVPSC